MKTLKEYFKNYGYLTVVLNEKYQVYIDYESKDLYVEICDNKGNCVNISKYVDVSLNTCVDEIKDKIIDYVISNYLYNYC